MRIFPWTGSLAAMWLFVFACNDCTSTSTTGAGGSTGSTGSGGAGTGGDAARSIVDTFCSTVAAPFCEAYYACCDAPAPALRPGLADDATSIPYCEQVMSEGSGLIIDVCQRELRDMLAAHLRDGSMVFDQAQFDTCLDLLKSMTSGGTACIEPPYYVLATTCISAFRGQIALGEDCPYPEDDYRYLWWSSAIVCKEGRCEYGKCVPFLKPGDACDLSVEHDPNYNISAPSLCNYLNQEVCWGDPGTGGAGGGGGAGGAGGASVMGTCRPQAELGDTCDPNNFRECQSYHCDDTGKCVLPDPKTSGCAWL